MQYQITIDDEDREHAPEAPWTAIVQPTDPEEDAFASGAGATPAEAVRDALRQWGDFS